MMIQTCFLLIVVISSSVAVTAFAFSSSIQEQQHDQLQQQQLKQLQHRRRNADLGLLGSPFDITYSDDGRKLVLTPFLLDVFEITSEELQPSTMTVIQDLSNKYLTAQLNRQYLPNFEIDIVNVTIVSQTKTVLKQQNRRTTMTRRERLIHEQAHGSFDNAYLTRRTNENEKQGTTLELMLDVTFDRLPSPDANQVDDALKSIMKDLTKLQQMIQSSGDETLDKVFMIQRRELPTPTPSVVVTFPTLAPVVDTLPTKATSPPSTTTAATMAPFTPTSPPTTSSNGTDSASGFIPDDTINRDKNNSSDGSPIGLISGTVFAAALIVLLASYFVIRKRRREEAESIMMDESQSDLESSMQSATNTSSTSPKIHYNGESPSTTGSHAKSTADSVFSGLSDPEMESLCSPRNRGLLSKKSMSSQTTVQASGKGPVKNSTPTSNQTPTSLHMIGSLFAFEEVSLEDDDSESQYLPIVTTPDAPTVPPFPATDMAIVVNNKNYNQDSPCQLLDMSHASDAAVLADISYDDAVRELVYVNHNMNDDTPIIRNNNNNNNINRPPRSPAANYYANNMDRSSPATSSDLYRSPNAAEDVPPTLTNTLVMNMNTSSPHNSNSNGIIMGPPSLGGASSNSPHSRSRYDVVGSPSTTTSQPKSPSRSLSTRYDVIGALLSTSPQQERPLSHISPRNISNDDAIADLSASDNSPLLVSPKRNKYTGLAATSTSAIAKPSPHQQKYKELLSMGWKKKSAVPMSPYEPAYEVSTLQGAFPTFDEDESPVARHRRHAGYEGKEDGAADYQNGAMHPLDWSNKGDNSVGDSTMSSHREALKARKFIFVEPEEPKSPSPAEGIANNGAPTFASPTSNMSTLSGHTQTSKASSHASASRQLIQDLVWLEEKIASGKAASTSTPSAVPTSPSVIEAMDSLSYVSGDEIISPSSNEGSTSGGGDTTAFPSMQSIVCRDCYAPPGKLQIVIHSTKDGPSVHTVKPGSSLLGHLFPGDLIIAVDNVDTRTFTAEGVMKMMASKHACERKITVLHFEEK